MPSASTLAGLKRRLEKLEQAEAGGLMPRYMLVRFIEPPLPEHEPEIVTATCRGERYTRQPNEPLDAFIDRMTAGAKAGEGSLIFTDLE